MALRRCKYLGVKDGERLSRNHSYRCLAPEPDMPVMPASITLSYAFKWPPNRGFVQVDQHCEECPLYERLK